MQTDDVEFELTSSILDTPSLMTPNIVFTVPTNQSTYNPLHNNNENHSTSNPSSIRTTTTTNETSSTASSADVKVSKIEDELKQTFGEQRRPTPSPFQKISSNNTFILDKPPPPVSNTDDGATIEIPSTADVVKELEALTNTNQFQVKMLINDHNERETNTTSTINGDQIRYGSPPTGNTSVIVSPPKKTFLIRSQSHTEPRSPLPNNNNNNNNLSQSQKQNNDNNILNTQNGLDDDNSMDDPHFARTPDLSSITHPNENQQFKSTINNGNDQHFNIHLRTDQNNISHPILKQQQQPPSIIINNKRTFQQANLGNNLSSLTKANTIIIPQSSLNEVTSTDQSTAIKRQRTTPIPTNPTVMNFRTSFPPTSLTVPTGTNSLTTNGTNPNVGSDDNRKKQIRDSNREAARRCRERRRQYIEQLEGNLEHHKLQIKQLTDKLVRIERENTQLRAILTETKVLQSSSRLSLNESHVDYANIIAAANMDHNSESNHQTDGGTIQRNYINRNNL